MSHPLTVQPRQNRRFQGVASMQRFVYGASADVIGAAIPALTTTVTRTPVTIATTPGLAKHDKLRPEGTPVSVCCLAASAAGAVWTVLLIGGSEGNGERGAVYCHSLECEASSEARPKASCQLLVTRSKGKGR